MLYTAGGTAVVVMVVVLLLGVAETGDEAKASGEDRGPTGLEETGELSTELCGVSVGDPLLDELSDDDSC